MTKERPSFPLKLDALESKKNLANRTVQLFAPVQANHPLSKLQEQTVRSTKPSDLGFSLVMPEVVCSMQSSSPSQLSTNDTLVN